MHGQTEQAQSPPVNRVQVRPGNPALSEPGKQQIDFPDRQFRPPRAATTEDGHDL